jgi:DEAD/DEAH box helicase domain-containing protein
VRYKLKNSSDGSLLTEMDELQAYREIYRGAIYMHEGLQYLVESMDTKNTVALAKPVDGNYYTVSCDTTEVRKLQELKRSAAGRTTRRFGDVRVSYTTLGFRRQQFHNHQNLGYETLDRPLSKTFETEGFWIRLPDEVRNLFLALTPQEENRPPMQFWKTYAEGLGFALLNATMMATMTTHDDIGSALLAEDGGMSVCVFDMYAGGLGFADKGYDRAPEIIMNAVRMIGGCPCKDGCAACVGDYHLDKTIILWGLKSLLEESPVPKNVRRKTPPSSAPRPEKPFRMETLAEEWGAFREALLSSGDALGHFLASVSAARTEGSRLVLALRHEFSAEWLSDDVYRKQLEALIRQYAEVPADFDVGYEVLNGGDAQTASKLGKMHRDLAR